MLLQNRVDLINMIQTSVKALVWYKCVTVLHSQLRCVIGAHTDLFIKNADF